MTLDDALRDIPLIAILRGVKPEEVCAIAEALVEAGVRAIEVPLNSPDPFNSVAALARNFGARTVVGAGTVLRAEDVDRVAEAGGRIVVAPNTDTATIARALALGLEPLPGFYTPSDAFVALHAGAKRLKLFPASSGGPAHLKQIRAVLPEDAVVYAVGGAKPEDMGAWREAGAQGLGLGAQLYRPGQSAAETAARARRAVDALRASLQR